MLEIISSSKFKKDFKTCEKRRYNMKMLKKVIDILRIPDKLPLSNRDHNLSGNYMGYKECHIAPDWLLIYRQNENELLLYRTGTHADLFGM